MLTVVVCAWDGDLHFLPHVFSCLRNQVHKDFEVVCTIKSDKDEDKLNKFRFYLQSSLDENTCKWIGFRDDDTNKVKGHRERNAAMSLASGSHITWLMADNLVYPHWTLNHWANFQIAPDSISIVNTFHWKGKWAHIKIPTTLSYGGIDLLNFAMPLQLAKDLDAFGEWQTLQVSSDWYLFRRAMLKTSTVWDRDQEPCACHF